MPTISRQQADALRVMEWMYSERLEDRRSGRTFVLALAALRHAFNHAGRWVDVEDHHHDRNSDDLLLRMIHDLARQCDIRINVDRRRFRVDDARADSRRLLFESFTVGEANLGIPPEQIERIRRQRGEPIPARAARKEAPRPPPKSQWERLNGDDPV